MCHTDALLWRAREIASMALSAARERHAENVWHIALRLCETPFSRPTRARSMSKTVNNFTIEKITTVRLNRKAKFSADVWTGLLFFNRKCHHSWKKLWTTFLVPTWSGLDEEEEFHIILKFDFIRTSSFSVQNKAVYCSH